MLKDYLPTGGVLRRLEVALRVSGESSARSASATGRLQTHNFLKTLVLGMGIVQLRPEQMPNQTMETS